MAKVISDEILKLKIIINGDDAQKQVTDLEEANKKLSESLKELKDEHKKVDAERKNEEKSINSLADKIDKLKNKLHEKQAADIEEIKTLKKQQSAYDQTSKQYQAIQSKIEKVRASSISETKGMDTAIQNLKNQQGKIKSTYDVTLTKATELKSKISAVNTELTENKQKISQTIASMDIMNLTSTQLNRKIGELSFTMKNMNPNLPAYKAAQKEMIAMKTRAEELRTGATGSANSIGALADKFNRYQGIALAVSATLAGVALSLQSVIDLNNKLADAQTTVSKTTGMNKQEVDGLTRSFSEFDTRTSRMDLLKISEIGGRLGVPKAEIKDFTREVDKAFVALGDGFTGGVEAVANKLGKIKGLFKETKNMQIADAMNQVGSAMNELGAAGAASEENIAEFALRVGSLPDVLKPTISDALALGAAFEESGIDAERSGTAYTNFISTAAKNTKAFAEVMRVPEQQVKNLINSNPTEFFLQFAQGLKGLDATELAKVLEHLKLNDQYVKGILGSASENTDRFRKSMELSNKSLTEATSLQEEFNKVNNNAAAIYDKVRKKFLGMFTSDAVAKSLNFTIEIIGRLLGVVDNTDKKTNVFRETIVFLARVFIILATSIISVSVVQAVYNNLIKDSILRTTALEAIEKGRNLRMQLSTTIQNLWNLAVGNGMKALGKFISFLGFQTAATNLQTTAQERLNLVTRANPWMAILSVITLLITAYITYKSVMENTAKAQKSLNEVLKEGVASAAQETSALDKLYKTATNVKLSTEERLKAVKQLKAEFPSYFGQISDEIIMNGKARASYIELREAIISSSRSKAASAELERREGERLKRDEDWRQRTIAEQNRQNELIARGQGKTKVGNVLIDNADLVEAGNKRLKILYQERYDNKVQDLKGDQFYINAIDENNKKAAKLAKDREAATGTGKSDYKTDFSDEKKDKTKKTQAEKDADAANRAYENMRKKILESADKFDQQELERAAKLEDAKADIMKDGFVKEYMQIKAEEQRKLAELEKNKHSDKEYSDINIIIQREKGALKKQFEEIKKEWQKNDADYSELQMLETEKTKLKLATLSEKYSNLALKQQEEALKKLIDGYKDQMNVAIYENDTVERQKAFLAGLGYSEDSLAKIKTWEEGRKEIEKYYQQKTLEDQVNFLKRKIAEFNVLMATMPLSLSPEQIEQIEKYKIQINELLAEITKLKNGDAGGKDAFASLKSFGSTDLLGLTSEQWTAMFKKTNDLESNILKVAAAMKVAQQMFAQYSAFVQANEQAMLRKMEAASARKQRRLKTELDTGAINQATYKKLTIENEIQLERKKAELALKTAKRERAMNIASAITGTAVAVVGALGNKPWTPFNMVLAGIVGAMGALQLATIMTQPLPEAPGAEEGFYPTIREQDGKVFNARRKRSATGIYKEPTMLVGEAGASMPELVVSGKDLKRINPNIQRQYMQEIQRVRGYEDGLYPNPPSSSGSDEMLIRMMDALNRNSEVMEWYQNNRIEAVFGKTARNGKDLKETVKKFEKLENNSQY